MKRHRSRMVIVALLAGGVVAPGAYAVDNPAPSPGAPAAATQAPRTSVPAPRAKQGVIRLDETVISGNQELPKVLYIVPWQDPSGMPNIEISPEFTESQVFRRLYPPAYRRELQYYDLLEAHKTEE